MPPCCDANGKDGLSLARRSSASSSRTDAPFIRRLWSVRGKEKGQTGQEPNYYRPIISAGFFHINEMTFFFLRLPRLVCDWDSQLRMEGLACWRTAINNPT